jgi:WD40 repeat protein
MAAYSPDGATLATASPDGLVRVWDAETGRQRLHLKRRAKPLHAITYSPDGRTIAGASGTGTVTLWDVRTGRSREAFDWGIGAVRSVAFAPDGMRAAAGGDGVVAVWDIDDWGV